MSSEMCQLENEEAAKIEDDGIPNAQMAEGSTGASIVGSEGQEARRESHDTEETKQQADIRDTHYIENGLGNQSEEFFYGSSRGFEMAEESSNRYDGMEAADVHDQHRKHELQTRRVDSLRPLHRTVHILGTNPVGKFIAHSLAGIAEAPSIALFVHHPLIAQQWYDEGQVLRVFKDEQVEEEGGIVLESSSTLSNLRHNKVLTGMVHEEADVIEHLVVTAQAYMIVPALSAIKQRLRPYSTICFVNDGLGIVEHVTSLVFPDPSQRPNYILGNISHLLVPNRQEGSFSLIQQSTGRLSLTMLPRTPMTQSTNTLVNGPLVRTVDSGWSASTPSSTYLMRVLTRSPALDAIGYNNYSYLQMHLQRLTLRAVIDTISVLYDCHTEELLSSYHVLRTIKLLLGEISNILFALPESRYMPNPDVEFSVKRLETLVLSTLTKMGPGKTTTLHLVQNGKQTDIDYSTGYLIRRANELGIACPQNDMMLALVKGKQGVMSRRMGRDIPFKETEA
ncbi:2-dehydropantoate 2-reductase [Phlyctema vagabunda]|uniref:2-dehydropantoate 2-reductase n=1 Tax=Phlyctema vagabunda TaxID=108571 RepID=A0ABR4PAV5_9HELO